MHELHLPETAVAMPIEQVRAHHDAPRGGIDPEAGGGETPLVTGGAGRMIDNGEVA